MTLTVIAAVLCVGVWVACIAIVATRRTVSRPAQQGMDRYQYRQRAAYAPWVHRRYPSPARYSTLNDLIGRTVDA